ncbi:MAG: 1-(5-phosphoribosyl)-5-((5-phosphoribosylamino)methylideneamino)imidazole-4-carboxamide isomerase [Acidimicrobiales bacterium]|jgi:hypothetical protein
MIEFVLMLTHDDETVPNARAVYEEVRGIGLRYVGFKDVGATSEQLREIAAAAHADELEVMLEVVSLSLEHELNSIRIGCQIGVDWILGGVHPEAALEAIGSHRVRYCPFAGSVTGHPSILNGSINEIAEDAAKISNLSGVCGVDLLAYRHSDIDVGQLTRAVVDATTGIVIAAGSVQSHKQIEVLAGAGAWGFTIGSALFEDLLPGGPGLRGQVAEVLRFARSIG